MANLDEKLSKLRIDKRRKKPARFNWLRAVILLIALGAAGAAYQYYAKTSAAIPVKTVRIQRTANSAEGAAPVVTASGYVIPRNKIEISSKVVGRVKEILVQRGDLVHENDILLRLDDEEYQAQLAAADAEVAALNARLAELRAGSRPQEIEAAKAAVASAEASLKSAQQDFERASALDTQGIVAPQDRDRLLAARDMAQARLRSERENAALVQLGPRKELIDSAEAQVRQAEAQRDYVKTQLDFTIIRAPITGTILEKLAERGELVTNMNLGGTRGAKSSMVSMADLTDLQVEIDLNETDLAKVKMKQPCEIRLDSAPKTVYKGAVDEIAPQADRQKGTVQVKVRLENPDDAIKIDVNARVTFLAANDAQASDPIESIWIPKNAVVQKESGPTVYLVANGRAVARSIKIGVDGEKGVQIADGLAGNEELILEPNERIADGVSVQSMP